jgi:hypothetical protein
MIMIKVVYNSKFGGFNLSREACQRYWEIKGQQVWIEEDKQFKSLDMFTVWLVPPEEQIKQPENWYSLPLEERIAFNQQYSKQTWDNSNVSRHDPILVQVVEELGDKANGMCAKLAIKEVSGPYRIDEYDGNETVVEPDGYDWITP